MTITEREAIRIARRDARTAYDDRSGFRVTTTFDGTNWHVGYRPEGTPAGGGPEYVISGETGDIVDKTYSQ